LVAHPHGQSEHPRPLAEQRSGHDNVDDEPWAATIPHAAAIDGSGPACYFDEGGEEDDGAEASIE
jgi:hypothetical protein